MRVAVVGHVEWVEFLYVEQVPAPGEIAHATWAFEEPAGGGAVAAVQLARLAGSAELYTALGEDEHGARSLKRLAELGVTVHAARRREPTRRAFTYLDAQGERTITTIGERLAPRGEDPLPWEGLSAADGVYVTAGDAEAVRAARRARILVASPRTRSALADSAVKVDALVFSDLDADEATFARSLEPRPALLVATRGTEGGRYESAEGATGTWAAAPLPGPAADSYGCGDSFAAALTYGLARGDDVAPALDLAARVGADCITGRGPYDRPAGNSAPD